MDRPLFDSNDIPEALAEIMRDTLMEAMNVIEARAGESEEEMNIAHAAYVTYKAAFEKLLPYMEDRPEVSLDEAIRCLEQVEGKETAEAVLRVIDSRSRRRADLRGS